MLDFICVSVNNWEKRKARKQQFMLHLSLRGDVGKVFYIEPPLNLARVIVFPFLELKDRENRQRWIRALLFKPARISDKLFVFTPLFIVPFSFKAQTLYNFNLYIAYFFISRVLCKRNLNRTVLWLYHPFHSPLINWFKKNICVCFDWAEEWSEYFHELSWRRKKLVIKLENEIIRKADLVFTVSRDLLARAKELNENSFHIFDGTVPELFKNDSFAVPEDMRNLVRPVIGYSGTIYTRMDVDLLLKLSRAFFNCSFVFVGEVLKLNSIDISGLKKQPNIYILGAKEYNLLPGYLMNFDVCIIPYLQNPVTAVPTKIYDYLAAGKPVVSTAFSEAEIFKDLIYIAHSHDEFIFMLKAALSNKDPILAQKRIAAAGMNTWALRVESIMDRVLDKIKERRLGR